MTDFVIQFLNYTSIVSKKVSMDPEVFDTRSFPRSQQFEAWEQWYGRIFDTTPLRPVSEGFEAKHLTWRLDGFAFSRVAAPAIAGERSRAHIYRDSVDHWVITLTTRGTHKVLTRDIVAKPALGVPFVQSLADPMKSERSDYDRVQLYLARDDFREIAALMDAARDVPLDTPNGNLLAEYLLLLERCLPTLQKEVAQDLKDAVRAMVAACIKPTADRMAAAARPIRASRQELVRRAVERRLRASALGTDMLCAEVGMSRSQLYRLLDGEGGVARYIQHKRLGAAYSELRDTTNRKSISAIAFDLCFSDASSFSRMFRRQFGVSPSDVRAASFGQLAPRLAANDRTLLRSENFGDLIRFL